MELWSTKGPEGSCSLKTICFSRCQQGKEATQALPSRLPTSSSSETLSHLTCAEQTLGHLGSLAALWHNTIASVDHSLITAKRHKHRCKSGGEKHHGLGSRDPPWQQDMLSVVTQGIMQYCELTCVCACAVLLLIVTLLCLFPRSSAGSLAIKPLCPTTSLCLKAYLIPVRMVALRIPSFIKT